MTDEEFYSYEGVSEGSPASKKKFIIAGVMVFIIIAGGIGLLVLTGKLSNPLQRSQTEITEDALPTAAPRTVAPVKALQSKLATSVKNLTAGPKTPKASGSTAKATITSSKVLDIQTFIELAEKEPSLDKSYAYYVKAYLAMVAAYKETKDGKYLTTMVDLKRIVVRYPEYKEGDFPIATQ